VTVIGKQLPCLYLNPEAFLFLLFLFSPLVLPREESEKAGGWVLDC